MAEIIQTLDLTELSIASGTPKITATALAEGLAESLPSNAVTYNSEYLSYYLKQDSTYEVTGINSDYSGIAKIIIPSVHNGLPVTSIGASAFYGELTLENVYIPRSITKIGARAFENCASLANITIEDDIYYTLYFRNTAKWENVYIAEKYYGSELYKHELPGVKMTFVENDGEYDIYSVKISKNDLGAISFNNGSTYSTDIYLSDIRNSACWQMEGRIPKRYNYAAPYLLSLGQYAFANIGGNSGYAKTITLPSTVGYIPASAFYEASYTSIEIPDTVRGIGEYAFSGSKLMAITIPDSVISIGNSAFENTQISRLTIPHSVTSIGSNMCNNCKYLTSVTINGTGSIGDYAFYNCSDLTELNFGDSSGITSIGISAFENTALPNIVIPDTVTWIGKKAFWGVNSAEHAMFENNYGWFYTSAYGAYDGTHWKPDHTGGAIIPESRLLAAALTSNEDFINMNWYRIERMVAPTISLSGALLTITDSSGIADSFNVYVDGTCKAAIDAATGEVELK